MIQIDKRLTAFVWNAPALDLTGSFAWKNRIRSLRRINPAGAGYSSFDPSRPANSLTMLQTGDVLTLDALGITAGTSSTYFDVDNGDAPQPRVNPDFIALNVPAGPAERVYEFPATYVSRAAGIDVLTAGASIEVRFNGGAYLPFNSASNYMITNIPASDFSSNGPGCLVQFRVTMPNDNPDDFELTFLLNY